MKVINFFAEPGAGKSTVAAGLFYLMKFKHLRVELVTEYAKDVVWRRNQHILQDQFYISGKQNHKLFRLQGHELDFVITDSPLPISLIYVSKNYPVSYEKFIMDIFNTYDNINVLLNRVKPYEPIGRNQTEKESYILAKQLREILDRKKINYTMFDANENAPKLIMNKLLNNEL